MAASNPTLSRKEVEALVRRTLYDHLPDAYLECAAAANAPVRSLPRLVANISARHVHLNQDALATLFGDDAELTVQKKLYQEGAFAAAQTVTVFGPRLSLIHI